MSAPDPDTRGSAATLYLPDFWTPDEVKGIQVGLLETICKCLEIKKERVFILTSLITSGHVVEDGKIVSW